MIETDIKTRAKLLAIGDVHLGTRCSGLPEDLASWGVEPNELTPAHALTKTVDLAIREKVDAVLFAGDVVESANARFEAMRYLERDIRRLLEAGVAVVAVAGNHDVEALPRIAGMIEGFTLLGANGTWASHIVERQGEPVVELVGWSFESARVAEPGGGPTQRTVAAGPPRYSAHRSAACRPGRIGRILRADPPERAG